MRRQPLVLLVHLQAVLKLVALLLVLLGHTHAQPTTPAVSSPSSTSTNVPTPSPSRPPQCVQCPHSTLLHPTAADNNTLPASNYTDSNGSSNDSEMTCYLHSQCVPRQYLCSPALGGEDCDHSENQAPLTCGSDGICYSTNDQLPYPSPGKGAPSASQCDNGYFVALVGDKYTRSCLIKTAQPPAECSDWEYSFRGYCFLATCNATASCAGDYECAHVDPVTHAGVCKHPSDLSDEHWGSSGENDGDDDDGDDAGDHYAQDMLMEGLLISTSSLLFGGLVGACFWYRKRRRERRIQWERQGHGSRQGSSHLGTDGHVKGTRFLPSWIGRRWRPHARHGSGSSGSSYPGDAHEEGLEEDGAVAATAATRQSFSGNRQGFIDELEGQQDTRLPYGRHNNFFTRRWFWNLDGGFGGQHHQQRQGATTTVIGMLDMAAPELDPPPVYTQSPESGPPTYGDATGEAHLTRSDAARSAVAPASPTPLPPPAITDAAPTTVARPEAAAGQGVSTLRRSRHGSIGSSFS